MVSIKYWVSFKTLPYGRSSKMIKTEQIPTTSKKDALEFKKVFQKDPKNWDFKIEKVR